MIFCIMANVKFTCKPKAVRRRRTALGLSGATESYALVSCEIKGKLSGLRMEFTDKSISSNGQ
jgi:hypothetical protein